MQGRPPAMGLGTSGLTDPSTCRETITQALRIGYRHIDTAQMYGNEQHIGDAIAESEVDREELFLATKIHHDNLAYTDAKRSARESLERLGVHSVDLLYVHWPRGNYEPAASLRAMDELREEGVTAAVGVSNFTPELLEEAFDFLDAPVVAHQVECHPLFPQHELRRYADRHDHSLVAYCPLGKANTTHPVLEDVAEKHDVSVPNVCLAWGLSQERIVPIPKATGDHLRENWEVREIDLDDEDLERIDGIAERRRLVDPPDAAWH